MVGSQTLTRCGSGGV